MATNNAVNNASPYIAAHSLVLSQGANNQTGLLLGAGQIPIGTTASDPSAATLTAGNNISITSISGSITIAATGFGGFVYNDVAGTSQAAAINNGYIISNAAQTTVTLPATAAEGSVVAVVGKGAAGWVLAANTGQTIKIGNTTTSTAGSLTSTDAGDCVYVVCTTANVTWRVTNMIGNLTVS